MSNETQTAAHYSVHVITSAHTSPRASKTWNSLHSSKIKTYFGNFFFSLE